MDNNVEIVRVLIRSDRRLTKRMIASELNLNHTTVYQILTQELVTRKLCAEHCSQKPDNRKDLCLHLLERIQSDRKFLKNVITGDETWIFEYDPEIKITYISADKVHEILHF